jgi:hypothetical protein
VDALWEDYRGWSPYQYSLNNPVRLKDPSGLGEEEDLDLWEVAKGATAAAINDYSFGVIDFTKSSNHPHFQRGVEAGHFTVALLSAHGAEGAVGTATASRVVTAASGGTAAEVSEPIAWISTAGAFYLSGVSIYATTQYMQSKATEVGGGEKKEELKYAPTKKHKENVGWGTEMDLDDKTAQEVLNNSLQGGKQRYGVHDGKVYEFQPDNTGGWHGYPVKGNKAPSEVLREFLQRGDITKPQYNKLVKGKQ